MVGRLFCLFDLWLYFGLYLGFAQVVGWIGKSLPAIATLHFYPTRAESPSLLPPPWPAWTQSNLSFITDTARLAFLHFDYIILLLFLAVVVIITAIPAIHTCCGLQLRNCCNNNNKTDISNRAAFNLINFIALAANKSFTFCSYPISYLYSSQFLSSHSVLHGMTIAN